MSKLRSKNLGLSVRLYVAGHAPNSLQAIANARAICDAHLASEFELEIVDLLENPRQGLADGIVVTPALPRLQPLPIRRLVGNLSDADQVLLVLSSQ